MKRREDRQLWNAVARTVEQPTRRQDGTKPDLAREMQRLMGSGVEMATLPPHPKVNRAITPGLAATLPPRETARKVQHPIEERIVKNLAKGRQKVDARIDLHGYTQDRARSVLLDFLATSRAAGHRIVLVITGKGERGAGVLRRNVPLWLDTPPFAQHLNGRRIAHGSHGGEGALYVRLRRPDQGRP